MKIAFTTGGTDFIGLTLFCLLIAEIDRLVINDELPYVGKIKSLTVADDYLCYCVADAHKCDPGSIFIVFWVT